MDYKYQEPKLCCVAVVEKWQYSYAICTALKQKDRTTVLKSCKYSIFDKWDQQKDRIQITIIQYTNKNIRDDEIKQETFIHNKTNNILSLIYSINCCEDCEINNTIKQFNSQQLELHQLKDLLAMKV